MACRLPTNVEGKCLNVREKASSIDASFYSPSPQISDHCFQNIDVYSTDEILSQDTFHLWQAASHQCKLHRFVSKKNKALFAQTKLFRESKTLGLKLYHAKNKLNFARASYTYEILSCSSTRLFVLSDDLFCSRQRIWDLCKTLQNNFFM